MLRLYLTLLLAIDELLPVQEVNPGGAKFHLTERHYLQFRAEFFNLFNHPQFDDLYVYPGNRNNPQAQNHQRERLWVQSV